MTTVRGRSICLLPVLWLLAASGSLKAQKIEASGRPVPVLTGRVVMEDGTPPPDKVAIECVGADFKGVAAYTHSDGVFNFQLDLKRKLAQDIKVESKAPGAEFRMGIPGLYDSASPRGDPPRCSELRATLPGFRSSTAKIESSLRDFWVDVGTIVLHRLVQVEGTT